MSIEQSRQLLNDFYQHIKQQQPQLTNQQAWQVAYTTPLQDVMAVIKGVH
ncbi:hypothetical protein THIOSC15_2720006 [uncultured Thiomicrorhabdus sp.]